MIAAGVSRQEEGGGRFRDRGENLSGGKSLRRSFARFADTTIGTKLFEILSCLTVSSKRHFEKESFKMIENDAGGSLAHLLSEFHLLALERGLRSKELTPGERGGRELFLRCAVESARLFSGGGRGLCRRKRRAPWMLEDPKVPGCLPSTLIIQGLLTRKKGKAMGGFAGGLENTASFINSGGGQVTP